MVTLISHLPEDKTRFGKCLVTVAGQSLSFGQRAGLIRLLPAALQLWHAIIHTVPLLCDQEGNKTGPFSTQ